MTMRTMTSDAPRKCSKKKLSQAATPGDGSPLVQKVNGNFRGGDRGQGGIYEGQVSEKEGHGSF